MLTSAGTQDSALRKLRAIYCRQRSSFVNQPARVHNVEPSLIVIDSLQCETLLSVSRHAQILDTVNWYQAARTRAGPSIFDTG
jgi:hypothetical protein